MDERGYYASRTIILFYYFNYEVFRCKSCSMGKYSESSIAGKNGKFTYKLHDNTVKSECSSPRENMTIQKGEDLILIRIKIEIFLIFRDFWRFENLEIGQKFVDIGKI